MSGSIVDDLREIVNDARGIVDDLGVRVVQVTIRTRMWDGGGIQTGTATVSDREILPRPKVIGVAGDPTIRVTSIVPAFSGGGYTPEQLNPPDLAETDWFYVVTFPDGVGRPFKLLRLTTVKALRYELELESLGRVVPF